MSTKTPGEFQDSPTTEQHRTDPRPKCILLGTDGEGCDHFYMTRVEAVVVVEDGERVWRQDVAGDSVESWVVHIGDVRGWTDQRLYTSAADALAAQVSEGGAA